MKRPVHPEDVRAPDWVLRALAEAELAYRYDFDLCVRTLCPNHHAPGLDRCYRCRGVVPTFDMVGIQRDRRASEKVVRGFAWLLGVLRAEYGLCRNKVCKNYAASGHNRCHSHMERDREHSHKQYERKRENAQ